MKQTKKRTLMLLTVMLSSFLLTACTSQSTPIGERAMVRLIYLDCNETGGYHAVTVVCDFSPESTENGKAGDTVILSADGDTVEKALNAAAGSRGGKPFFAQNRLLLLSDPLAEKELTKILRHFADTCSVYRDPSVWLWTQGEEGLTQLQEPMTFVRAAESLARRDELGCVRRILENGTERLPSVLPILGTGEGKDTAEAPAAVKGLAFFEQESAEYSYREEDLLAYGMLYGRSENIPFTIMTEDGKQLWQIRALRRIITKKEGHLLITLSGSGTQVGDFGEHTVQQQRTVERQLEAFCTAGLHRLTKDGARDCLDLTWWCEQLDLPPERFAETEVCVKIRIK